MKGLIVAFFLAGVFFGGSVRAQTRLLNGAAAVINKRVVTVQDAYVFRSLQRLKTGAQPLILEEEGEDLRKTVQKIVFEDMVLAEMKNIQKEISVRGEVAQWLKEMKEKRKGVEVIKKRYGLTEADLIERISRTLSADKFVQMKIETVTPVITEDEVQKYFKRNEAQFRGRSYENLKPNIVVLLKKQAVQKSLEEWIKSLKDKYEVSLLLES
jgi:predicted CopG family antitoxin